MENVNLPEDFEEFLKLLNEQGVRYLLIGGYAVGYYGYPRTTADMDIWIDASPENAERVLRTFHQFGLHDPALSIDVIREPGKILRMGVPPMRIEVLNEIDGVVFDSSYANKERVMLGEIEIDLISLRDLKENKRASGRHKDLDDLEHLQD